MSATDRYLAVLDRFCRDDDNVPDYTVGLDEQGWYGFAIRVDGGFDDGRYWEVEVYKKDTLNEVLAALVAEALGWCVNTAPQIEGIEFVKLLAGDS